MPTYEYQCSECGSVFDLFQSIKSSPLRKAHCEECGDKRSVRRLIGTGGAVIFKGAGFYQTDYRSDTYNKAAKAEAEGGDKKTKKDDKAAKDTTPKSGKSESSTKSSSSKKTKTSSADPK